MTSAAHRALLRTCLAADDEVESRLRAWEGLVDLDDVDGPTFELLPYLHTRLVGAGVPARDAGRIKGIYARAWYLDRREQPARRSEGAVLVRGLAMRSLAYGGQSVRSAADTAVLGADWSFADACADPAVVSRAIRSARQRPDEGIATPDPAYHLLDALLRGSGWHPDPSLVPLLDAGLLVPLLDGPQWDLVVDEVRRCRWRAFVEPRLRLLASVGAPVPPPVAAAIAQQPAGLAARLVATGARGPGWQRRALRGAYGLYLADPGRAHGARAAVDYPVRNARLGLASLRRRRSARSTSP